jgi:HSP20 family protein
MARYEREQDKRREKERKALAPWRPLADMSRWERDMEQIFDDFFTRRLRPFWDERRWPWRGTQMSVPAVDLYEEKDQIIAKAELPGIEKDDIQVNITDHLLTIMGEKKKEEEIKEKAYYRAERSYGSFSRTVELPSEIQFDKARASFKNGVLEIRLPKSEEARKKEVKVKVE